MFYSSSEEYSILALKITRGRKKDNCVIMLILDKNRFLDGFLSQVPHLCMSETKVMRRFCDVTCVTFLTSWVLPDGWSAISEVLLLKELINCLIIVINYLRCTIKQQLLWHSIKNDANATNRRQYNEL